MATVAWEIGRTSGVQGISEAVRRLSCGSAINQAWQVTERLPALAPADPAQDAFPERVDWCACGSVVFVHDGSS